MSRYVKFNLDLAKMILDGKVKAKFFSVDGHEMNLKEVDDQKVIFTYINKIQSGGDGPEIDKSYDVEVDYRGYFDGDKYRAVSVDKVLIFI